jgi:SnoaL-like polyketide cyclase
VDVTAFVDRVMALWRDAVPEGEAGVAAFGTCYAAELTVNGTRFTLADLVERARALQRAYAVIRPEVLEVITAPERIVLAFVMHVEHTGPLVTPLGVVPPTGRASAARTIDILEMHDERITGITVVADELGLLLGLGAVRLS